MISSGSHTDSGNAPGRRGFTLVEVLIAVGIIGLLMTIMIMAIVPALESARINATKVTINQINDVIQQRIDAINQADLKTEARALAARMNTTPARAEFILRKNLLRQALPQRQADLHGFDMSPDGAAYDGTVAWKTTALAAQLDDNPHWPDWCLQFTSPAEATAVDEFTSSQMLLFGLTQVQRVRAINGGKSFTLPVLDIDTINRKHVANPETTGPEDAVARYFIDDWGQPLRFYRWPTGLVRDASNGPILISGIPPSVSASPGQSDPDDPTGLLATAFGMQFNINVGGGITARPFNPENYHDIGWFSTPLVMSAGPDNDFGMSGNPAANGATDIAARLGEVQNAAAIFDNITNRQQ